MSWWAWLLLWTLLVAGAAALVFVLARRLWRQAKALTHELGAAADRFGAVTDRLQELQQPRSPDGGSADGVGSRAAGPHRVRADKPLR